MYALNLNEENRVLSVTFSKYAQGNQPRVETLPEGNIAEYQYINGEFVHNPLPVEVNKEICIGCGACAAGPHRNISQLDLLAVGHRIRFR